MILPNYNITAERAKDLLVDNNPLVDFYISGNLDITDFDICEKQIYIENCIVDNFTAMSVQFLSKVELINSEFKNCIFTFAYFTEGLKIQNCIFQKYLDFQCGGHNKKDNFIEITNSIFQGFVNFFDCIYEGPVKIKDNDFMEGTNFLAKNIACPVSFEIKPITVNNKGKLDIENEGN